MRRLTTDSECPADRRRTHTRRIHAAEYPAYHFSVHRPSPVQRAATNPRPDSFYRIDAPFIQSPR